MPSKAVLTTRCAARLIHVADRNPEQVALDEAKGAALTLWRWAVDQGRRYLTASLLKFMLAGVIAIGLAGYSLPVAAVALTAAAVVGGLIYGVYGQRIAHDERASRRWTWIAAKRLQQDKLRMEQRLDAAVFACADLPSTSERCIRRLSCARR